MYILIAWAFELLNTLSTCSTFYFCWCCCCFFQFLWCVNFLGWFESKIKPTREERREKQSTFVYLYYFTSSRRWMYKNYFHTNGKQKERNGTEREFYRKNIPTVLMWHDNCVWITNEDYCGNVDHEMKTIAVDAYCTCLCP